MTWDKRLARAKKHVDSLSDDERWALWQALAGDGHRFYGDGGTIHSTGTVDVCLSESGEVTQVWFRCQNLPFNVGSRRDDVINPDIALTGVVVTDSNF